MRWYLEDFRLMMETWRNFSKRFKCSFINFYVFFPKKNNLTQSLTWSGEIWCLPYAWRCWPSSERLDWQNAHSGPRLSNYCFSLFNLKSTFSLFCFVLFLFLPLCACDNSLNSTNSDFFLLLRQLQALSDGKISKDNLITHNTINQIDRWNQIPCVVSEQ